MPWSHNCSTQQECMSDHQFLLSIPLKLRKPTSVLSSLTIWSLQIWNIMTTFKFMKIVTFQAINLHIWEFTTEKVTLFLNFIMSKLIYVDIYILYIEIMTNCCSILWTHCLAFGNFPFQCIYLHPCFLICQVFTNNDHLVIISS